MKIFELLRAFKDKGARECVYADSCSELDEFVVVYDEVIFNAELDAVEAEIRTLLAAR